MKKKITPIILITLFAILILNSEETKSYALDGLNLWLFTIIPTLLPFMILSSIILETGAHTIITRAFGFLMKPLFGLSSVCAYPVFIGFLCGMPMGAKITADMVKSNRISILEGNILLTFCNNLSPTFIISYLSSNILLLSSCKRFNICLLILASALISGIILSRICKKRPGIDSCHGLCPPTNNLEPTGIIDRSILKSFENITNLGGYIILFTILSKFLLKNASSNIHLTILSCLMEITSGLDNFNNYFINLEIIIICCILTSIGGLCSFFQTWGIIKDSGLHIRYYIYGKTLSTFIVLCMTKFFSDIL